jgi:vanillate O-demethylase monooxygenase subunit
MLIKNAWYAAAHAEDLRPGGILARTVVNRRMAICRREDGSVFALEDRCPHRLVPLSLGRLVDGALQCGYHGATFDETGRCIRVPGQETIPDKARATAIPVRERYGLIWVWPGDPAKSGDESTIPDFFAFGAPPYDYGNGQILSFAANYELIVDNLLDATHAEFVHRTSFGSEGLQVSRRAEKMPERKPATGNEFHFSIRDDGIDYQVLLNDTYPGPCFRRAYEMKKGLNAYDGTLDWHMDVAWQVPGTFIFSSVTKEPGAKPEDGIGLINLHALTPETEHTTHYFFRNAYRFAPPSEEIRDFWHGTAFKAFQEDKLVIEAQKRNFSAGDVYDFDLAHFDGDRLGLQGREILRRRAALEA